MKFDDISRAEYDALCQEAVAPYIDGSADSCSYCDRIEPLILVEGERMYITLALGQIVPGYLQIVPREHRTSLAGLREEEIEEFEKMKGVVRSSYSEVYGTSAIAFEHGKVGACMMRENEKYRRQKASLCHHTHVHFVPANVDVSGEIARVVPEPILVNSAWDIKELRQGAHKGDPYLFFEGPDGQGYFFPVEDRSAIPRQFLRTTVATALGCPERADWFRHTGFEHFYDARNQLMEPLIRHLNIINDER